MDIEFCISQRASLVIFVLTIATSIYALEYNRKCFNELALRPYYFFKEKKYLSLITSGFLHGDFNHLIFNMLTFYFFAFDLECTIGFIHFLILYFGALILSDLHTLFKHKDDPQYSSIGASGAITAVIFASVLYDPNMGIYLFFIPIAIPAPLFAFVYVAGCVYLNKNDDTSNINHLAHLWGGLAGIGITIALNPSVVTSFLNEIDLSSWF